MQLAITRCDFVFQHNHASSVLFTKDTPKKREKKEKYGKSPCIYIIISAKKAEEKKKQSRVDSQMVLLGFLSLVDPWN